MAWLDGPDCQQAGCVHPAVVRCDYVTPQSSDAVKTCATVLCGNCAVFNEGRHYCLPHARKLGLYPENRGDPALLDALDEAEAEIARLRAAEAERKP